MSENRRGCFDLQFDFTLENRIFFRQRKFRQEMSELQTAQLPQQDITSAIHYLKIASLQDHITFIGQCLPDMTSP